MIRRMVISTVLGCILVCPLFLHAQEGVIVGIIEKESFEPITLGLPFPYLMTPNEETRQLAQKVREVLIDDLKFSQLFHLLPEPVYTELPPYAGKPMDMLPWKANHVQFLILLKVGTEGDRVIVEARLWDVATNQMRIGRRYVWRKSLIRKIAHRFADEIIYQVFGLRTGLFESKIAFVSTRTGNKEIFVMDYDGKNQHRVTENKTLDLFPDLRPNHHQVVYTTFRGSTAALVFFDLLTGEYRQLIGKSGLNTLAEWSPDGKSIVFVSAMAGNAELYTIRADGSDLRRLTYSKAIESSPTWSPTGKHIAFTSDRSGTPQIYIMDADGSNVRRLTYFGDYNDSPAWSPDGVHVAFVSRHGLQFDIYVMDITTNEVIRLTENQGSNESPFWAPDGLHLVFSSNRTGKYQLYVMDRFGKNVRQLTFKGENTNPSWRTFE